MGRGAETGGRLNRWSWVETDLGAIRHNVRELRSRLSDGALLMCAVKADAYGHGAVPCAKAMLEAGADQLAVATVDEGVELRDAGIDAPVLMLNECPPEAVGDLLSHSVMPSIYTEGFAKAYAAEARRRGLVGRYHLAVDTGMTRIGVMPQDAVGFRRMLDSLGGLSCEGTFTHFSTADEPGSGYFGLQAARFSATLLALHEAGLGHGLAHCDNTPGLVLHPEMHLGMCRAGISLYGLHPADSTKGAIALMPAMSVRARVTRVATPGEGACVGYGAAWGCPAGVSVATVPIGYADGLHRALSGRMDVIVNGVRVPQVGRICMDQFMVAIDPRRWPSWAGPVEIGDVVTILGRDGDEEVSADDLAEASGTINYEVTCAFGMMRLGKVFR